jgi:hypothetical protein
MKNFIERLLERIAHQRREREIELYLTEASDAVDFENRVRNVERAVLGCNRGFAAQ